MYRVLLFTLLTAIIAACGSPPPDPTPTPEPITPTVEATPTVAPTPLTIAALAPLPGPNPFTAEGSTYRLPLRPGAYEVEPVTQYAVPLLAEGPPPPLEQVDGVWQAEVSLRPDAVWSDGTPLTAHDWAFTASIMPPPGVQGITAPGDHTARITFSERPTFGDYLYDVLTAPIVARHYWGAVPAPLTHTPQNEPLAGPYTVTAWGDERIELSANPRYIAQGREVTAYADGIRVVEGGRTLYADGDRTQQVAQYAVGPHIERVAYRDFITGVRAWRAVEEDQASMFSTPWDEIDIPFGPNYVDVSVYVSHEANLTAVRFNTARAPLNDPALRQVLAQLIDPYFLTQTVLGGSVYEAQSVVPAINRAWGEPVPSSVRPNYNEAFTLALGALQEAGYSWEAPPSLAQNEPPGNAIASTPLLTPAGDEVPPLTIITPGGSTGPYQETTAVWIADGFLADIGITAEWIVIPPEEITERIATGDYDIALMDVPLTPYPAYLAEWFEGAAWYEVQRCTTLEACQRAAREAAAATRERASLLPIYHEQALTIYRTDQITLPWEAPIYGGMQPGGGYPHLLQTPNDQP
jgi:ABC-type transport system substrate-binding protein